MRAVIFLLSFLFLFPAQAESEIAERESVTAVAAAMFIGGSFSELEELAARYRTSNARTSSGTLKYPLIYRGIWRAIGDVDKGSDEIWEHLMDKADSWIHMFPDSPTAKIAKASVILNRAGAYRGTRYIQNTPQSDLDNAVMYYRQALDYLVENSNIKAADPRWYREMMSIYTSLGAPRESYAELLNEAISTHPRHDDFYLNATVFYTIEYGGSPKEIDNLALLAKRNTESERGFEMYARVYWGAPPLRDGTFYLMNDSIDWEGFKKGVDAMLTKYPTQWNLNHLAFFVCMRGDWKKTKELLARIEEPIVVSAWQSEQNFNYCKIKTDRWEQYSQGITSDTGR